MKVAWKDLRLKGSHGHHSPSFSKPLELKQTNRGDAKLAEKAQ
jgi:hypothetical protein